MLEAAEKEFAVRKFTEMVKFVVCLFHILIIFHTLFPCNILHGFRLFQGKLQLLERMMLGIGFSFDQLLIFF